MNKSDSTPQLVRSAPPSAVMVGPADEVRGVRCNRTTLTRPGGRPPKAKPVRREETCHPPLLTGLGLSRMDTPQCVKQQVVSIERGGKGTKNTSCLHAWTCQFSSQQIQMLMSHTLYGSLTSKGGWTNMMRQV